jgi:hypothetical protein
MDTEDYFDKWVHDISLEMNQVTRHWIHIGELLNSAALDGAHGKVLKRLCSRVGIAYPTATKLIRISECPRLQAHADQLASIDSWPTLYEIVLMTDAEFDDLEKHYFADGSIASLTRLQVSQLRKSKKQRTKASSVFSVYLDIGEQLTTTEKESLRRIWHELETGFAQKLRLKLEEVMTEILNEMPLSQSSDSLGRSQLHS